MSNPKRISNLILIQTNTRTAGPRKNDGAYVLGRGFQLSIDGIAEVFLFGGGAQTKKTCPSFGDILQIETPKSKPSIWASIQKHHKKEHNI